MGGGGCLEEVLQEGPEGVDADGPYEHQAHELRDGRNVDDDAAAGDVLDHKAHELGGGVRGEVVPKDDGLRRLQDPVGLAATMGSS